MPIARFWVGRIMLFGHGPKQQARVEGTARHVQSHKVVPHCLLGIFLEERAGSPPNAALDTKHHNASSFEALPSSPCIITGTVRDKDSFPASLAEKTS